MKQQWLMVFSILMVGGSALADGANCQPGEVWGYDSCGKPEPAVLKVNGNHNFTTSVSKIKLWDLDIYCFSGDANDIASQLNESFHARVQVLAPDVVRYSGDGEKCVDYTGAGPGWDVCNKTAIMHKTGFLVSCDSKF